MWPGRSWRTARTAASAEGKHGLEGSDPQSHPRTAPRLFDVTGDATQRLKSGETARYAVDRAHVIRNVGKTVATAWLVVVHPG